MMVYQQHYSKIAEEKICNMQLIVFCKKQNNYTIKVRFLKEITILDY